jgi:hypothetical protein
MEVAANVGKRDDLRQCTGISGNCALRSVKLRLGRTG